MQTESNALIEQYYIPLETPKIEGADDGDIFLVRHGMSDFNVRHL